MVTENFNSQLKWFTRTLIEMRARKVEGYHTPIDFDLALITNCPTASFDTANKTPEWHAVHMLKEIKGFLVKTKKLEFPAELFWAVSANDHIEIDGYTTELLKIFLKEFLDESACLFGEEQDNEGRAILAYCGQHTSIHISGTETVVFRCLKETEGMVPYEKFYEALNKHRRLLGPPQSAEKQKTSLQSAINVLEKKLKKAAGYSSNVEIIKNNRKEGYKITI